MAIVGKTRNSASFRRNRRLLTAVLLIYLVYTFTPLLYLVTAATKTNPDLFTTFGLWFSRDFHLFENLEHLFTNNDGVFRAGCGTASTTPPSRRSARRWWRRSRAMPSRSTTSSASGRSTRWCSVR